MFKKLLILSRRKIHSTASQFCRTAHELKYNYGETEKILSVVNNIELDELVSRFAITKNRAQKLKLYQGQCGNLESIDQILHIDGFGLNILNKFCRSILNERVAALTSQTEHFKKPKRNTSYTLTPISDSLITRIQSFTSIYIGMTEISWGTYHLMPNETTKMTQWDYRQLPELKLNLYHLAAFMSNTLKDVPKTDFYVFENPSIPAIGSSSKRNMNVQIAQMIGMASVIAAERNTLMNLSVAGEQAVTDGVLNVAFFRKFLFARLFKLYVGSERISSTNLVKDLVQMSTSTNVTDDDIRTMVTVDSSLEAMYLSAHRQKQDCLGCSFLLGLAFLRLCLLKCPKSIKLVS